MNLNKRGSKVVGSRRFTLFKYICTDCHTKFLTGLNMKPPKDINCVLIECNYFLTSPGQMKDCFVMIHIKVHYYKCE